MLKLAAQQIFVPFCGLFPILLVLHIKRTKLCKWRAPHTNSLCDVNMSGQVWIEMPGIVSLLVLCSIIAAVRDFRASGEPNLLPVEAIMAWQKLHALLEKRHFCTASINTPPALHEGVSFLSPCSLSQTGGHCCRCWPLTCSRHAYAAEECGNEWVCVERGRASLWSLNVLDCGVNMSGRAACTPMAIRVANCAAVLSYEAVVRFSSRDVWILFHVDAGSAPHRRYCCWGMWSPPALHSYLSAASLERSTGSTCDTVPSAQADNTLVIAGHGRQEGSLFNLILCKSRCLLMYFPCFEQTHNILTS